MLPRPLRVAVGWSASVLVLGLALVLLLRLLMRIAPVTFAVVGAVLLAALLQPLVTGLRRLRLPAALAALAAVAALLGVLLGAAALIWRRAGDQLPDLRSRLADAVERIRTFLVEGPLSLDTEQVDRLADDLVSRLREVAPSPYAGATTAVETVGGLLLAVALLFLLLKDGERMWMWLAGLFPVGVRDRVDRAGREGWTTLTSYVRGTVLVAAIDAVGIGLALLLLGVPLTLPLVVLTFLGAFIPIVGATVAGAAAVLVALVTNGVTDALLVLAAVVAVQQVEGNLLQPFIMGRALRLHPLVILVAVSAATLLGGIPGAVVAVPVVAVCYRVASSLRSEEPAEADDHPAGQPAGENVQ
ncbi:MAG TPA: AI-2E family transporter [Mycobacteriales bacterium]